MKKTIKSLLVAALMTGFGTTAFAQLGETETINITARVLKQIALTGSNIQFGAVTAGNIAILDPIDPADNEFISIQAFPGRLLIDATGGEPIQVTWPAAVTLVHTNATDQINFVPRISAIWGDIAISNLAVRANSILLDDDDAFLSGTTVTGAAGTGIGGLGYFSTDPTVGPTLDLATFFIGGNLYEDGSTTVAIPSAQETGTYTATMTFNVNYYGI